MKAHGRAAPVEPLAGTRQRMPQADKQTFQIRGRGIDLRRRASCADILRHRRIKSRIFRAEVISRRWLDADIQRR